MAYTTIDDPSAHFQTMIFTGDGNDNRALTNDGNSDLQPDWIWFKNRATTNSHNVLDSTRGVGKTLEGTNSNSAEGDTSTRLTSFDSDGFTVKTDPSVNGNTNGIVAWQWKANGGTRTTVTESGSNPGGGHQSDTTAGFSIVDYVGTGGAGHVTHGLGVVPEWIIMKNRDEAESWLIYHVGIGNGKGLRLDTTAAADTTANHWANTTPNANTIVVGGNPPNNKDGVNYIAYCFASIKGYSKFGSYIGNGAADGPFIYTGFKPAWILYKNTGAAEEWVLQDTTRDSNNPVIINIRPDSNIVEASASSLDIDFLSNGFKNRSDQAQLNSDGVVYIYMAFAESPFVTSTGIPTTAR